MKLRLIKEIKEHPMWTRLATHREELEERILENPPLLILVGNHWNINFAQVLREQEDETNCAVGKKFKICQSQLFPRRPGPHLLTHWHLSIWQSYKEVKASAHMSFHIASMHT